jgi:hypothetical protein
MNIHKKIANLIGIFYSDHKKMDPFDLKGVQAYVSLTWEKASWHTTAFTAMARRGIPIE